MIFDEFNDYKRKINKPPSNAEFIKMIINILGDNMASNYSVSEEELTKQLQIILKDEFVASVHIKTHNTINLHLINGERFNIKIEKGDSNCFF